ncbi:hypothetical protein ACQKFO_21515 [Rossellomorea sp. NPDC071047]|uniref:hypothetical protein n=1 Tax=Rossellomorea sp. NPDC071047 TaxID=3390675 RepID=UPI003D006E1D
MEILMDYNSAKKLVEVYGWSYFLKMFNKKYPGYRLYSVSKAWFEERKYICKLKGGGGDIIIRWFSN